MTPCKTWNGISINSWKTFTYLFIHPMNLNYCQISTFFKTLWKLFWRPKRIQLLEKKLFGELFSNLKKITMYRLKSNPMFHYIVWPRVLTFKAPFSIWIISDVIGYYAVWTYWPTQQPFSYRSSPKVGDFWAILKKVLFKTN